MDRYQASILIGWIEKNLENCDNPRIHGKPLIANHSGKWRYRVGDYRILALIEDDKIKIVIMRWPSRYQWNLCLPFSGIKYAHTIVLMR